MRACSPVLMSGLRHPGSSLIQLVIDDTSYSFTVSVEQNPSTLCRVPYSPQNKAQEGSGPLHQACRDRQREAGPDPTFPTALVATTKGSTVDRDRAARRARCTVAARRSADRIER